MPALAPEPQLVPTYPEGILWRLGRKPTPWAWSGWEWATDGRFSGRWDDPEGNFRTVYAGSSLLGCLLEVLACLRADPRLVADLGEIVEDDEDGVLHPSLESGTVPLEWLDRRTAASAVATGKFCAVTAAESVAVLRPHFIGLAMTLGLTDLDAAALKDARPRALTQAIASHIFATGDFQGVQFSSRHGDDQKLWAIFEQPGDPPVSPLLDQIVDHELQTDSPDILEAFRLLGLVWEDD